MHFRAKSHARHTRVQDSLQIQQDLLLTSGDFHSASFAAGFGVRGCRLLCSHCTKHLTKLMFSNGLSFVSDPHLFLSEKNQ